MCVLVVEHLKAGRYLTPSLVYKVLYKMLLSSLVLLIIGIVQVDCLDI